jgi:hypothetical protein
MDAVGFTLAAILAQDLLSGGAYKVSKVNHGRLFIYQNSFPVFFVSTWHVV